jgi:TolB-like protein/DNA-binding SARP family transcriptional activator
VVILMIRLSTLGGPRLAGGGDERTAAVLSQPKRLALLVYLAIARPRGAHRRDTLLAMFWPELDESHARHALSQSLHFLRRCLGHDAIVGTPESVALNEQVVQCDVVALEAAIAAGDVESALALYQGDLLTGFHVADAPAFEQWAAVERARLQHAVLECAHARAEQELKRGGGSDAVRWAARALELAPTDERAIRRVMRARDAGGDRVGALRDYQEFASRVEHELEATPSPETQRLAASIKDRNEAGQTYSGDHARSPQPVPQDASPALLTPAVSTPVARAALSAVPERRRVRAVAALAIILASVGIASAAISYSDTDPQRSLVVLPFADMGATGTDEYLADGLTEDLTTIFSRISDLVVASRTSAFAYKKKDVDVREIGKFLGVASALEGSVRRQGDSVRITAQLIDATTGYHIWSEHFHRPLTDIFVVQEEIAVAVGQALGLARVAASALPAITATNVAAYDAYLRGRHLLEVKTRPRTLGAIEQFQRAIAADSTYARAFAGLADAYVALADHYPPRDILPMAQAAAQRAYRLDSTRIETRLAVADLRFIHERDWDAADREFRAAIRMEPRSVLAHERYARFLGAARRFDEHIASTKRALDLRREQKGDPVALAIREHSTLAAAYFAARRFDEALEEALAAAKLDPGSGAVNAVLGRIYIEAGRYGDAIAALDQAWPASQQLPALARLGYAYGRAGRQAEARRVLAQLRARADTSYVPKDQIALVQLGLGDRDGAIASLWQAYEDHHWWLPWINQSPPFDVLRSDNRYRQLLRALGAPPG